MAIAEKWADIDDMLDDAHPNKMCDDAIVAIARTTYSMQNDLSAYQPFISRVKNFLEARDGNSTGLLKGLLD